MTNYLRYLRSDGIEGYRDGSAFSIDTPNFDAAVDIAAALGFTDDEIDMAVYLSCLKGKA